MIQPLDTCMRTLSALITSDIPAGEAAANACIETYLATFPGLPKQVAALSMLDHAVDQRLSPSPFLPVLKGIIEAQYKRLGTSRN
ncbi:hypothetical protein [Methylobacterium sp. 77]|uniref:hypothetical protein n=1 Tax=Methylobacterium sp. 77 TaxID=1101192 RepID=UPI0012DC9D8F|nr:hypothetical protein [Methylobacterium sp. 77]